MTCANCPATAVYVYAVTPSHQTYYCTRHLPLFLNDRAKGGELTIPAATKTASKKKATEPVVKEPVVEEPVVEEVDTDGSD